MNKDQAKAFESTLLEKRQELVRSSSGSGTTTDLSQEYGRDEGDRANASQSKGKWLGCRPSRERGLGELIEGRLAARRRRATKPQRNRRTCQRRRSRLPETSSAYRRKMSPE